MVYNMMNVMNIQEQEESIKYPHLLWISSCFFNVLFGILIGGDKTYNKDVISTKDIININY